MKNKILIVEDDKSIRKFIKTTLTTNSYQCITAENGKMALELSKQNPDLLILDLGLPDIDGIDIIKRLRAWSNLPIIIVSARDDYSEKIDALDAGADDYITKPFNIDELLARVRVALRRKIYNPNLNNPVFINGKLKIDFNSQIVYVSTHKIHLTPIEYKILILLSKNVGKVLTHRFIMKEVWINYLETDIPSLRVFVASIRKKIEILDERYIETHIGVGYRMIKISNDNNYNVS